MRGLGKYTWGSSLLPNHVRSLSKVKELYQRNQAGLGLANETLRVRWLSSTFNSYLPHATTPDQNLALRDQLYSLRSEAKDAFNEAKALGARWMELQDEKKGVYQVPSPYCATVVSSKNDY